MLITKHQNLLRILNIQNTFDHNQSNYYYKMTRYKRWATYQEQTYKRQLVPQIQKWYKFLPF